MFRSIMVPLDGSDFGEYILPMALGIARHTGAAVRLVHVIEPPAPSRFNLHLNGRATPMPAPDQEREQHYLAQMAGFLSKAWNLPISTAVLSGPAATTLRQAAIEQKADLVLMTTHGYGPLTRMWLGSVAHTLARTLPMPLLLTRPHGEPVDLLESVSSAPFQRVLLPLDGSPVAEQAIAPALELGQAMDAEYVLLQAIEPPMLGYAPAAQAGGLEQRVLDQWREIAQEYLAGVAARLRAEGLKVTPRVVFGAAAPAIADYAREHAIDLIAMTTHGRGGTARLLLGSVADRLVHSASAPVLLYRAV